VFRVKKESMSFRTCAVSLCPFFGYLNIVLLTILDNTELTVLKEHIKKLEIQLKNDRMSLVFKKVNGKIQRRKFNRSGLRIAVLAKRFIIKVR